MIIPDCEFVRSSRRTLAPNGDLQGEKRKENIRTENSQRCSIEGLLYV